MYSLMVQVGAGEGIAEDVAELGGAAAAQMLSTGRPHAPAAAAARQGQYEAIFSDEGADVWYGLQLKPTAAGDMAVIGGLKQGLAAADGGWGLAPGLVLVGARGRVASVPDRRPPADLCRSLPMFSDGAALNTPSAS